MDRQAATQRFYANTNQNTANGCWEWTKKLSTGYGRITVDGKLILAHRFSWEIHFGPIPPGLCVLHRCDNRRCVSPACLFVGTKKQNAIDMATKGRQHRQKPECPNGHTYTAESTGSQRNGTSRVCRICAKLNMRKRRAQS